MRRQFSPVKTQFNFRQRRQVSWMKSSGRVSESILAVGSPVKHLQKSLLGSLKLRKILFPPYCSSSCLNRKSARSIFVYLISWKIYLICIFSIYWDIDIEINYILRSQYKQKIRKKYFSESPSWKISHIYFFNISRRDISIYTVFRGIK